MTTTVPIPQPRPTPLLGNLPDLDRENGIRSLMELAGEHGPIFRLQVPGGNLVVVSSAALVEELCDETRFTKALHRPLREVRDFAGDGLFTAETGEPNWQTAHRILMPALGPATLPGMVEGMVDIADQLLVKWERLGPEHPVDVVDDTTRLTLDTIGLCAFGYRFNSFYTDRMHPFVTAMIRALDHAQTRTGQLPFQRRLALRARHQYQEDRRLMYQVADQLIADRRRRGPDHQNRPDLLDAMLFGTDPQSGASLPDENIRYQVVTFLIAGHETTSGLLSFAIHELLRHPDILEHARTVVDTATGGQRPGLEHLRDLGYLDQVLKETLRLWPTAPAFAVRTRDRAEMLAGRYHVDADDILLVLTPSLHRDPQAWGTDVEVFDPGRFAPEHARQRPAHAWKPFGNGQRSCIGRGFALQEANLFLAMMLQRFDITPADPGYTLEIAQTLTIKPRGLRIHAHRRDIPVVSDQPTPATVRRVTQTHRQVAPDAVPDAGDRPRVQILYGSNAGTCQSFAHRLANDAVQRGWLPTLNALDDAVGQLTADAPLIILTSSYEGKPPDNARRFVAWLDQLPDRGLDGIRYTVCGCGNSDWVRTYQAVPIHIDGQLERTGGHRLHSRGEADAAGDLFGDLDDWATALWTTLDQDLGDRALRPDAAAALLELEFAPPTRTGLLRHNRLQTGTIVANEELVDTAAGGRSKRHVEIALPTGIQYQPGDYLAVLPTNPTTLVDRALARFGLAYEDNLTIHAGAQVHTLLPTDRPVAAGELLANYVELAQPASRAQIEQLASTCTREQDRQQLEQLSGDRDAYTTQILQPRISLLDLLARHPDADLSFASFLQALPPLAPRRYSISSSPHWNPGHATVTVSVVNAPAWSGHGTFEGTASTFLARTPPGQTIPVSIHPANTGFHPPESLDTPIIMVAAGTGIAPFRGFLQHRALQAEQEHRQPAPALLFFGCNHPRIDYLYRDDIHDWTQTGIVDIRSAFSDQPEHGGRYVQDRLWRDRADVIDLVRNNATLYLCGDGRHMAPAVHDTCIRIYQDATGADHNTAETWVTTMEREHGRYVADVFA